MIYGSVCSGIEAATVAWEPLGWRPAWFAEVAEFPSNVLAHHYPTVTNHGDFTKIDDPGRLDLLVGGTPCQSFSIAGLRGGLVDERGNLALEFFRLAARTCPRWIVWENVPGVLSSGGGRDFGSILGALAMLGYGFAYRVLDAQFYGVPQRRRRVFVVGYLGDWRPPAAVLFEPESLRGDPPSRARARRDAARGASPGAGSGVRDAHALTCHAAKGGDPTTDNYVVSIAENQRGEVVTAPVTQALGGGGGKPGQGYAAIAFHPTQDPKSGPVSPCLSRNGDGMGVVDGLAVRRLTPRECERLQGFPDDYTAIPGASDSARYKALGNSMAVPVMRWIGRRIDLVEQLTEPIP